MENISELIYKISASSSDSVALCRGLAQITYRELNLEADQLAGHFFQLGVMPGDAVAICLPRSFQWVIAALAAIRVGAAYVPMDLAWPDERMRYVLKDSGSSIFVAGENLLERLTTPAVGVDPCRDFTKISEAAPFARLEIDPSSLAYVIYTSGSTGVPKGVEITHSNLSHLIQWHIGEFSVTKADHASHLAGLAFDAAAWEIWPYLATGSSISMVDEMVRTSSEMLQHWMVAERITIGFVPTALAGPMIAMDWPENTALRVLLTGGDTLHMGPKAGLPFKLVNNYGPTECSVVATSGVILPGLETTPSIGWPITGTAVYLLDERGNNQLVFGQTGEIYIGGAGVGRGYRNLPDLTAKSFLPDIFSEVPSAQMYRTGDLGVILPDGQIGFRGRIDDQEKIRGQRVELGEITTVLNHHPDVAAGIVVTTMAETTEKYLLAYVVPAEMADPSSSDLQAFLSKRLPAYMIPSVFVRLESIPLSPNGKIDRSALPAPSPDNVIPAAATREPISPIEETLLAMVQELLDTTEVTIKDDFFLIGGHSLLGTQLVLRVRKAFGVEMNLRHLFVAGTVERLALIVEDMLIAELASLTDEESIRQVVD
jgi:amino acid adenylation domain-containing protein